MTTKTMTDDEALAEAHRRFTRRATVARANGMCQIKRAPNRSGRCLAEASTWEEAFAVVDAMERDDAAERDAVWNGRNTVDWQAVVAQCRRDGSTFRAAVYLLERAWAAAEKDGGR